MERGGTSAITTTTTAYEVRDLVKEDAKRFEFFYKITVVFLLLISGIVEALSYQYLDIFTGFMTGTVIMMGSSIATIHVNHTFPYDSLSALCGFCFGSYLGGALMAVPTRSIRTRPLAKLQYCLAGVALSLLLGIILLHSVGIATTAGRCAVAFVLAVGMGTQMSGQVGLNVPDLTSPLATGNLNGIFGTPNPFQPQAKAAKNRKRLLTVFTLWFGALIGGALTLVSVMAPLLFCVAALCVWLCILEIKIRDPL